MSCPGGVLPYGLTELAKAEWDGSEPPPVAGFVTSAFSPLVAAVAEACLTSYFQAPPSDDAKGERTGIVLVSTTGDLATHAAVASAVQAGRRVPPLLFYQSNHNAVAGYVAARWGLSGPVVCTMPGSTSSGGASSGCASAAGTPLARAQDEAVRSAALLIEDGDADAALAIAVNAYLDGTVEGTASLIGPASWALPPEER
jgi:3-oxoacyl-(acyl-carrier-protein) synthase